MITLQIHDYWILTADDYHAFDEFKDVYIKAGIRCKFTEIGMDRHLYCAVFWIGKKPTQFIRIMRNQVTIN